FYPYAIQWGTALEAKGVDDRTGRVEEFDFIRDRLVFSREIAGIETGRHRVVDPTVIVVRQ
ncbi:MAG: hypothetical protein U0793_23740, partial [Gemmataceae bacterium]